MYVCHETQINTDWVKCDFSDDGGRERERETEGRVESSREAPPTEQEQELVDVKTQSRSATPPDTLHHVLIVTLCEFQLKFVCRRLWIYGETATFGIVFVGWEIHLISCN